VFAKQISPVQPHYPGMGRGLARSLSALVRGTSNYIRVCRTPESGLSEVVGNSVAGPPIGYPPGRHYGSPAVALELRLNVEVDCQGVPGRYILHRVGSCTKVDKRKAVIRCLSWHRMLCGDDAHTMSIRMVWVTSMDFVSQEHGVPRDGPKDSNAGG
jgi:hypothetical protein